MAMNRMTQCCRWLFASALLLGVAEFCLAQDRPMPPLPAGRTAPAVAPAPAATPAPVGAPTKEPPRPWSGESGASGHPLMQASAIREAAANFASCLEQLWPLAAKRDISRASFDKQVRGLTPDLRIMDLLDAQPEFTKAFWDYLDILVSEARIATGRELITRHKATFDQVE